VGRTRITLAPVDDNCGFLRATARSCYYLMAFGRMNGA
jgi:hypothetical protein